MILTNILGGAGLSITALYKAQNVFETLYADSLWVTRGRIDTKER